MAASKRARSGGKPKPGDCPGVPDRGGKPAPRARVARRGANTGAVPQEPENVQPPLPDPRAQEPTGDVPTPGNHPSRDALIWHAAIARAASEGLDLATEWNERVQAYVVPSGSDPEIKYIVRRDRRQWGKPAYKWEHFVCSCAAHQRGFLVCKHKAAAWLYREANKERLKHLHGK